MGSGQIKAMYDMALGRMPCTAMSALVRAAVFAVGGLPQELVIEL